MLRQVEERGSAYLPQVNAFYVREFQMMRAAEDAARFLHHACQGLPQRMNGHSVESASELRALDRFYAEVIEHAVAYFGSRVLYPARPALEADDSALLSRASLNKAADTAVRSGESAVVAREFGYRIGSQSYDAYLAGAVPLSGLRRLFLARLDEPGVARKICAAVIAKLRSVSRPMGRGVHA